MRNLVRKLVYATPLQWLVPEVSANSDPNWWNTQLSGPLAAYLGGTLSIDMRNSATVNLMRQYAAPKPIVLDVGCAGGTLALAIPSFSRYIGIDISEVAVTHAQKTVKNEQAHFETADLVKYSLDSRFNVIVFNEVLYYLGVNAAVDQTLRYSRALAPEGIIIVSMKNDAKARAILQELSHRFRWIESILFQANISAPSYSIRDDRERPAYLVVALKA